MKAFIILVGTELLSGMTVDTNSLFMAEELNKYGIEISSKITVGDNIKEIIKAIEFGKSQSDLIIMSGGLGPTMDDLTKEAIAKYLGKELVVDPEEYRELKKKFDKLGIEFLDNNVKEVEKPEGAVSFGNGAGMAPGIYIDRIAAFPGIPRELYNLFPKFMDYYAKENKLEDEIYIKDILVWGIPESHLEKRIKNFFDEKDIFYEFLAKDYGIVVRLQGKESSKNLVEKIVEKIYNEIGHYVIGEDGKRVQDSVVSHLKTLGYNISLAESCTGGQIASMLVEVSGVSKVFFEGIVCYSNDSKINRLKVSPETLKVYGAVSEETAREMLAGLKGDVAIATTGIAGPQGGTKEKPVGTVYIGVRILDEYYIKKYEFKGDRKRIRRYSSMTALFKLLKMLEKRVEY
ncbi:CinA family nicotinamide mononucleotide deamidase-related protein [Ilyobacter polytropus]|uniref:CinA-like protein n=1 Tax=Ilyobacter polytropus (strain ATCC 51220 / DSM 2926 / LMG 16218 / CuHBu1) TaxID=572544 RepID=E3H933_ILYPC|nr:CinA family nicotinamide mononucleotide deamidase-related protein [Ilyobacter polytropus]ADO82005.1 competence/damage-inducible protein cinA [Ilyobacter polytropus DSM 2926]